MKKIRRKKRFTGRHHLDLIPLLVLLLILLLLVIFVVKMKEKTSLDSNAAYWSNCRCVGEVWIGERCPDVMRNMPCESGRPTVQPKPTSSFIESTIPPLRIPTKPLRLF